MIIADFHFSGFEDFGSWARPSMLVSRVVDVPDLEAGTKVELPPHGSSYTLSVGSSWQISRTDVDPQSSG